MPNKYRIGFIVLIACWQMQAARSAINFHIDAGFAAQTLNEFSRQADLQILFDYPLLEQTMTPAISGEMEADEALEALLAGTGFTYDYVNTRTLAISPRPRVDSDALSRALRGFEFQAQSWPEGAGPRVHRLIVEIVGASDESYIATR